MPHQYNLNKGVDNVANNRKFDNVVMNVKLTTDQGTTRSNLSDTASISVSLGKIQRWYTDFTIEYSGIHRCPLVRLHQRKEARSFAERPHAEGAGQARGRIGNGVRISDRTAAVKWSFRSMPLAARPRRDRGR